MFLFISILSFFCLANWNFQSLNYKNSFYFSLELKLLMFKITVILCSIFTQWVKCIIDLDSGKSTLWNEACGHEKSMYCSLWNIHLYLMVGLSLQRLTSELHRFSIWQYGSALSHSCDINCMVIYLKCLFMSIRYFCNHFIAYLHWFYGFT